MTATRFVPPFSVLARTVRASLVLLLLLGVALCVVLWPHWRQNPDLSHGFFMPVIFLVLLHEARGGTERFLPITGALTAVVSVLVGLGLLSLAASGMYAASLGWTHDLVAFTLTASFALLLAAGLAVLASEPVRWVPCNWSSLVGVGLWLLCAPIPPGTYSRLTLGLQLFVSKLVVAALHLLGVAAVRQGNIIHLANSNVGIEEACSGVRSLISCVFAGLFLSATLVRRPFSRALLVLLSAPLALAMNFLRSLTLTLLANRGIPIAGAWHDATGFAVLGITALLLAGLALLLERKPAVPTPAAAGAATATKPIDTYPPFIAKSSRVPRRIVAAGLLAAVVLAAWFYSATRPAVRANAPVPDLAAMLPASAAGWQVDTSDDLYQFRDTLHTDHLTQRTYTRRTDSDVEIVIVYLAYWRPGQASVSLVASHTPDACWPGAGWEALPIETPRVRLDVAGRMLPEAEMRAFRSGGFQQTVWYWHLYDGRPLAHENPNSPAELLRLAWRYGFRREGDQLFVRISSNRPWSEFRHEPFIESLFTRLQPLGL